MLLIWCMLRSPNDKRGTGTAAYPWICNALFLLFIRQTPSHARLPKAYMKEKKQFKGSLDTRRIPHRGRGKGCASVFNTQSSRLMRSVSEYRR